MIWADPAGRSTPRSAQATSGAFVDGQQTVGHAALSNKPAIGQARQHARYGQRDTPAPGRRYPGICAYSADHRDSFGRVIALSSPSPAPVGTSGVPDWFTGVGTLVLAGTTVAALAVTIWITTTDRRKAEAARRRDRQQDSAQRLLGRIAGIVPYFRLIPGVFQSSSTPTGHPAYDSRAKACLDAVRALEAGIYADMAGLGDARAADQYRELVRRVLGAAPGVEEGTGEHTSEALRLCAVFVRESLENLIEDGQSLPGQTSLPILEPPGDRAGPLATGHKATSGRHRRA